jgi:hypothetical protein
MFQALQTAKRKPSNDYTATDYESYGDIYALATILCPSKKLRYFASIDWQGEIDYVKYYHGVLSESFIDTKRCFSMIQILRFYKMSLERP